MTEFDQNEYSSSGVAATEAEEEEKETGRLEAFSDGVFAIAITLLVLEIQLPLDVAPDKLMAAALSQWPSVAAYVVSFLTILVMWLNHHSIMHFIKRANRLFFVFNGLLLMAITFLNFPTALVAESVPLRFDDQRFAALVYCGTMVFIALCYNLLWFYASRGRRLIARNIPNSEVEKVSHQYVYGVPLYAFAFVLAFFSPLASMAVIFAMALFFAFTGSIGRPATVANRRK